MVNSDSPTLPTSLLVTTAEILSRPGDRVVLGPSTDGGYYLLGVKARHRRLFEDVSWSTERVARQTRDRAAEIGIPVYLLPAWYDVDDVNTLRTLHAELFEGQEFVPGLVRYGAQRSQQLMRTLLLQSDLKTQLKEIKETLGEHDAQLNHLYYAIENLLDEKSAQRKWDSRGKIGF